MSAPKSSTYFHLHLVSDSTGETLATVWRSTAMRFEGMTPVEHVHPGVRTRDLLSQVESAILANPGIVLFTLIDDELAQRLKQVCSEYGVPCVSVLEPVINIFESYLNQPRRRRPGAQHRLDDSYFARVAALDFTLSHDDGQSTADINQSDIVLVGVSRCCKTPTSFYLAQQRGLKVANVPIIFGAPLPDELKKADRPLVVGLTVAIERLMAVRQNRILGIHGAATETGYVDRSMIGRELAYSRELCSEHGWPVIDITRRSIEETAAEVLALFTRHRYGTPATENGYPSDV